MSLLSNFDRFSALLSPCQREALEAIKEALQDDPTCLDTHRNGYAIETADLQGDKKGESHDD